MLLAFAALCGCGVDPPPEVRLRAMTYNIKHGEVSSLSDVAGVIASQSADVVLLEEVDVGTARSSGVDQARELGRMLGLEASFVPALLSFDGGQYGLALLSRFPIVSSVRIELASSAEQRIAALFEVEVDGLAAPVPVAVTHLSNVSSEERRIQAEQLLAALPSPSAAILGGDFNDVPESETHARVTALLTDAFASAGIGDGYTSPSGLPFRRIDFLFCGAEWRPESALVVDAATQSDHRAVIADFLRATLR